MHIMIMAQHFAPEEVSGAVLATELAADLVNRGHQVTFVTCTPNYPYGRPFLNYRNKLLYREEIHGVEVTRVWSYISPQKTLIHRLLNYLTFSVSTIYGGLLSRKPDVILSASPPLFLGLSAWLLSKIWNVPWVLRVEDLFPDAAISMGMLNNRFVIWLLYGIEKFQYNRANRISVISCSFLKNMIDKGVSKEKISVFPVWADPEIIKPGQKENVFALENNLFDKFVVLYAGNLGITSSLEDLILAATYLADHPRIVFLIIGEGVKKKGLMELVINQQLKNVFFMDYQPREKYNLILASADLSIVTLNPGSSLTSLPSKTFNILASGKPVGAIAPFDSELGQLIIGAECGIVTPPGQPEEFANAVLSLMNNDSILNKMGQNGRALLEKKFSRKYCVDQYEKVIKEAVGIEECK